MAVRAPNAPELAARLVADRASRSEHRAVIDGAVATDAAAVGDVPVLDTAAAPDAPVTETTLTTMAAKAAAVATKQATTTTTVKPKPTTTTTTARPAFAHTQTGQASWYNTATGTCAHRSAPMGAVLLVTDVADGKQIRCKVTDRGPFVAGRIVDLSKADFKTLEPASTGVIDVRVEW